MDPLSEALLTEGIVGPEKLKALKQEARGRSFVMKLFESEDVDEDKLVEIYTGRFKVPKADLDNVVVEALSGFKEDTAKKYVCIPFDRDQRHLKVAMVDPLDFSAIQDLGFITGMGIIPYAARRTDIIGAIQTFYQISTDLTNVLESAAPATQDNLEILEEAGIDVEGGGQGSAPSGTDIYTSGERMEIAGDEALEAPAIKLVNLLIKEALDARSSDIHIEPGQNSVDVRYRVDGVLKSHTKIPKWMHSAVISRIKIMSKLDISNRRTPQDGGIKVKLGGKPLDLRISTLPTHLGEKAVIRLLNPEVGDVELSDAGFDEEELLKIQKAVNQPQGMFLVTGPTGSGKTTTLHGILKYRFDEAINIITVEDPVEFEIEGITQVQVNEKAGLTFANTLRSILRQDPDIVMVGEIRDIDTGAIAFKASMTGHMVLSTLHTLNTTATITRLIDIGIEPFIVSSSLLCIVAQRLVRKNCTDCTDKYTPDESLFKMYPVLDRNAVYKKGRGCKSCGGTGYKGRAAVFEILEITAGLKQLISTGATDEELKARARADGMKTLFDSAISKVYKGITTLDEVMRVVSVESGDEVKCSVCMRTYTGANCPHCGDIDNLLACTSCQGGLESGWNFCPKCGHATQAGKEAGKPPAPAEKAKVLIVDDEPGILKMVELAIKPLGVDVHTANNGQEALDKVRDVAPNLVITDINMPVLNGLDMIKELRKKIDTMFIPIIILSSRDTAEDKLMGFTYGTDDYLTKPFDYMELQARVKRLLKRAYG